MNCPRCSVACVVTSWRPAQGLNPDLKQYTCSNCGDDYYDDHLRQPLEIERSHDDVMRRHPKCKPLQGQTTSIFL